jgi:hypothetical protein
MTRDSDNPAAPSQTLGIAHAACGDAHLNGVAAQCLSAMRDIIARIGRELDRPPLRPANPVTEGRHGVDPRAKELAVRAFVRVEPEGEWNAVAVCQDEALAARLAPPCWVRAGALASLLADPEAPPTQAQLQSIARTRSENSYHQNPPRSQEICGLRAAGTGFERRPKWSSRTRCCRSRPAGGSPIPAQAGVIPDRSPSLADIQAPKSIPYASSNTRDQDAEMTETLHFAVK